MPADGLQTGRGLVVEVVEVVEFALATKSGHLFSVHAGELYVRQPVDEHLMRVRPRDTLILELPPPPKNNKY